jgi:hypothetical protein
VDRWPGCNSHLTDFFQGAVDLAGADSSTYQRDSSTANCPRLA